MCVLILNKTKSIMKLMSPQHVRWNYRENERESPQEEGKWEIFVLLLVILYNEPPVV